MKKIILLLAAIGLIATACSQTPAGPVRFQETSLAELLKQSADEDKLVFVDMYATWCPPCKVMTEEVFSQEKAGAYFNREFINAKFDAEKGEGLELARKYRIQAYPTFLVLDSDGKEVGRIVGSNDIDPFIESVKQVAEGR
jgi:thiol:disulfide interchange protein